MAVFGIIYSNGDVKQSVRTTYFEVLADVWTEYQHAGRNTPLPRSLIMNGSVVTDKLSDLGWRYGSELNEALASARAQVQEKHTPDFWRAEIDKRKRAR